MCTAVTYKTKDFYFGRTLDYDHSYAEQVTVTPRRFPLPFRFLDTLNEHYAMIGMAHTEQNYPLYYDAVTKNVMAMLEPMIIVLLCLVVGTVAIGVMLPMFEMYSMYDQYL